MKYLPLCFLFFIVSLPKFTFAQRGRNGAFTTSASVTVNEYTSLTADAITGNTALTVANSSLNSHGRFSASLSAGDLVMIIQIRGANINGKPNSSSPTIATPNDSSWGAITAYNNCGNNEFREVASVPNGTTINLTCPLSNNYSYKGKVEVVRVPRYTNLTINSGGSINCDPWDSTVGGIIAIEVDSNTIINTGGKISASNNGLRGGRLINNPSIPKGISYFGSNQLINGADKGESVAGYENDYNQSGGSYCLGAPANGGGGGDSWNGGGGGGANAGNISAWVNGFGIPDTSKTGYDSAWRLEYSWLPKFVGAGGGRGGYTWCSNSPNPLTDPPGNSTWMGDDRRSVGGRGGRPLDYSTGRLFLGGGGGAGSEDDSHGSGGGNGGGIVYLISYGNISGGGSIVSNGQTPLNDSLSFGDGAGGGGAGGTILVNSVGTISGITISANGGHGGNQTIPVSAGEAEGPGGGGGGGYIATTTSVTETVTGGNNGTTLSFPTFPANGATKGGNGIIDTLYGPDLAIRLKDSVFCPNDSAYFQAFASLYTGGTIKWNWSFPGGNPATSNLQNPAVSYSSSGIYTVTLIDSACSGIDTIKKTFNLTVTPISGATVKGKDTICKGLNTTLTASGGAKYVWSTGATASSITVSPAATQTYSVMISNGTCSKDTTVKVVVNPLPSVTISGIASLCPGNNTIITATGGGTYLWNTGGTNDTINIKPVATTTYTLGVKNNGCIKDTNVVITVNPKPNVTITPPTPGTCPGTGINLTASGAFSYTWSPSTGLSCTSCSNTVATLLSAQTYTVVGTNLAGCKDTVTVTVNIASPPSVTINGKDSICKGSPTTLTATGGGTYLWNTGATTSSITVTPNITSTYTVGVSNGVCTKDTSVKIVVTPLPSITLSGNKSLCPGNSTIITASGGGTYSWNNGGTNDTINVMPASTTTYTLGVNNNGCSKDTSIIVTVNPKPNVTVTPPSASICKGTGVNLSAGGANSYSWAPSTGLSCTTCFNPTATPAASETYTVIGTSAAGCKDTVSVPITVNPVPVASISGKDTICSGSSTTLIASGGGTYSWNTGSTNSNITVSPLITTTYTVSVSNGFCTKDTTTVVYVISPLSIKVVGDSACKGTGSTIIASGGTSYKWIPGGYTTSAITPTPSTTSTYSVIISGPCGTDTLTAIVHVEPLPVITISGNDSVCSGTKTVLTASGASTYMWNTGNTNSSITVAPASTITYTVTGTLGKCPADTTYVVKVTPKPVGTISGLAQVCKGDSVTLNASGGGTYHWSNGATGSSISLVLNKDTNVYVVVTNGCSDTVYHSVTVPVSKGITACCDTIITPGGTAILSASGAVGYVWTPSANVNCYTCPNTAAVPGSNTTYTVTGTDSNGCTSSAIIIVDIECIDFLVPNVFTPNGDGDNDLFVIHAEREPIYSIEIYDRWGVKMYSSANAAAYWNGKIDNTGKEVPDGVYYYIIKADCGGKNYNHTGFVQVIR